MIDYLPANIPRILINRTIVHPPAPTVDEHDDESNSREGQKDFREGYVFDAYLLGFCDDVTRALGKKLFSAEAESETDISDRGELLSTVLKKTNENDDDESSYNGDEWIGVDVPKERVFLFPGALAPAESDAEEVSYQEVAHCDGCAKRIQGAIHKCVTCFDYDLCQKCFPALSNSHFDGKHNFTTEAAVPIRTRSP